MVYFDDLSWRSAGSLGYRTMFLPENDTGPDDAVHAHEGLYILHDPRRPLARRRDADILDIAPPLMGLLGLPAPKEMRGRALD